MSRSRKPDWLRSSLPAGRRFGEIRDTLEDYGLTTVCEEANCPNLGECWSGGSHPNGDSTAGPGTATFMLMGERCSRGCSFCDVSTGGMEPLDPEEPARVADAVADIGLDYVVLTSVDRDDLDDGGAAHIAETVREIKRRDPDIGVETLIPDFGGDHEAVHEVLDAGPEVVAHNVETVPRLQSRVRDPRAGYGQSLDVLAEIAASDVHAKTSLMLGVGEYAHEVYTAMADLREVGVEALTLGQYLRPSESHLPVERYVHPSTFETWREVAEERFDFRYCAAGPLVRSSYRAGEFYRNLA